MLPFFQFLLILIIVIFAAKLGGYLSNRLGQPAVAGEVLAGLILGPSVLNILHWPLFTDVHLEESVTTLAEIGVLLLMFIAGLDLNLSDLLQCGKVSVLAGLIGFLLPLAAGFGLAISFGFPAQQAMLWGFILAPTSVSLSAQVLIELGVLRSQVGVSLLGAAIVDDILVILGFSLYLAILSGSASAGITEILITLLIMVVYLLIAFAVGIWLIPPLSRYIASLPISQGTIAFVFVTTMLFAWSAEILGGMAAIFGAFLAGLFFARTPLKEEIEEDFSKFAYGIFVPVFFVSVGLEADIRMMSAEVFWFFLAVVLAAILSKAFGVALAGRLSGLQSTQAWQLGASMIPRGEVVLIVATVGVLEGFIGQEVIATVVGMVVITALITPPLLRKLFAHTPPHELSN